MNAELRQAVDRAESNTNRAEAENSGRHIFNETFSQQLVEMMVDCGYAAKVFGESRISGHFKTAR